MFGSSDLIDLWEAGQSQHPVDLALSILRHADSETSRAELADLSIGERDRRLLALRERVFGSTLCSTALCPDCGEQVEVQLSTAHLRMHTQAESGKDPDELACEDHVIKFRLPNSWDLAAITECRDESSALNCLLKRCVLEINCHGSPIEIDSAPDTVVQSIQAGMAERDPQAEILLDLACPQCERQWSMLFDIVAHLWTDIAVRAQRLLWEVHTLAKAYGWIESEILALSTARRRFYIQAVE